jgi:hypothetical protein
MWSQEAWSERGHVCRGAGPIPGDAWAVYLDLFTTGEEKDSAGLLLPEHLEKCGSTEPKEPVHGAGGRDAELAGMAHVCLAVDLYQHIAFEDAEDLIGFVVAMEVSDVVGRDRLHAHDESSQAVARACDDANLAGSRRERHLRDLNRLVVRAVTIDEWSRADDLQQRPHCGAVRPLHHMRRRWLTGSPGRPEKRSPRACFPQKSWVEKILRRKKTLRGSIGEPDATG